MLSMVLRGLPRSDRFGNPELVDRLSERSMPLDLTRSHAAFAAFFGLRFNSVAESQFGQAFAKRPRFLSSSTIEPNPLFNAFLSSSAHLTHLRMSLIFDTGVSSHSKAAKIAAPPFILEGVVVKVRGFGRPLAGQFLNSSVPARRPSSAARERTPSGHIRSRLAVFQEKPATSSTVPSHVSRKSSARGSSSPKFNETGFSGLAADHMATVVRLSGLFPALCLRKRIKPSQTLAAG